MNSSDVRYEIAATETIDRTVELAAVLAPTFHEGARAEMLHTWWTENGFTATIDEVGNVWAKVRSGSGAALVVGAHMYTAFSGHVEHGVRVEGDRLIGPSVGDDTITNAREVGQWVP